LRERGFRVVIADVNVEAGARLAEEIGAHFIRCDVSDLGDNEAAVAATVDTYGGLNLAALNAGIGTGTEIGENFDLEKFRRVIDVNLLGPILGTQAALPALRAADGERDIILTASIAGLEEAPLDSGYAAAKHGLVGFMRAQAPRLAKDGVRINALCPGFVHTELTEDIRGMLQERQIEEMPVNEAVKGFHAILDARGSGQAWPVLPGLPIEPFEFAQIRGLREVYPDPTTVLAGPRRTPPPQGLPGSPNRRPGPGRGTRGRKL
ncbi:MAG: SDR family NAD(P)-dependent oxidoreductase, partial [Terriglobales bacterium]